MTEFNPSCVVVFGGADHEEQAARKVAEKAGLKTATATVNGVPCHAGNAYKADGFKVDTPVSLRDSNPKDWASDAQVIVFECSPNVVQHMTVVGWCDHHNEGDQGYGLGPDLYWEASSIGQLCAILGVQPTKEMKLIAAGDHCPANAYRGECPGIDPVEFRKHRITGLSTTKVVGVSSPADGFWNEVAVDNRDEVEKQLAFAEALLRMEPETALFPNSGIKDLRRFGAIANLPEAALSTGMAYLSAIPDTDRDGMPTGKLKLNLGGNNSPETVTAVMAWLNSLEGAEQPAYGAPARGFAGRVFL